MPLQIGANHRLTAVRVQIFEARKEIDPELLGKILSSERREDLPGRPLKWEAALDALVDELVYR